MIEGSNGPGGEDSAEMEQRTRQTDKLLRIS